MKKHTLTVLVAAVRTIVASSCSHRKEQEDYRAILSAFESGDIDDAALRANAFIRAYPTSKYKEEISNISNTVVRLKLAEIKTNSGDYQTAKDIYERILATSPPAGLEITRKVTLITELRSREVTHATNLSKKQILLQIHKELETLDTTKINYIGMSFNGISTQTDQAITALRPRIGRLTTDLRSIDSTLADTVDKKVVEFYLRYSTAAGARFNSSVNGGNEELLNKWIQYTDAMVKCREDVKVLAESIN
jgi:tetratricopeptide (TPR) repeat protein